MTVYNQNTNDASETFFKKGDEKSVLENTVNETGEKVQFQAVLYPNRSLGNFGLKIVISVFVVYTILVSGFFLTKGAWPITGFLGIEILLVLWLLRESFKSARDFETVCLTDKELIIQEHSNRQGQKTWVFEPYWARVELKQGRQDNKSLRIVSHGNGVIVGEFLTDEEKEDLADNLKQQLSNWKSHKH